MISYMKKLVLVILDGVGDRPIESLGGKTPLELADTPNMDRLAKKGSCGLVYSVGKGFAPESDIAMYAILGYDPFKGYTGRAAFEAYGLGITLGKDELAFRGNLATVQDGIIIDARAGRVGGAEAEELIKTLGEIKVGGAEVVVKKQEGYRFLLILKGEGLSSNVSNAHPGYKKTKYSFSVAQEFKLGKTRVSKCEGLDGKARKTADAVNEFIANAHEILKNHPINKKRDIPANYILLRDAADGLPTVKDLKSRFGLSWGAVTERTVEKGICTHFGMEIVPVGKEKDLVKDCENKADAAIKNIEPYDCLYVYIKGPDKPSHDGDVQGKVDVIAKIDKHLIRPLVNGLDMDNTVVCVTGDHCTPCETRSHSDDPIPLLIYGGETDGCGVFSERECANGVLKTIQGKDLIELLIKTLNFKRRRD
jgi:2,3-bisphosphoglycerate-independent phosphoglycerate mutase